MRRGEWLFANPAMDQLVYDLWARIHAHHLVKRVTTRALKLLIVSHSTSSDCFFAAQARMHISEAWQVSRIQPKGCRSFIEFWAWAPVHIEVKNRAVDSQVRLTTVSR